MNEKTLGPFAAEFVDTLRDLNKFIREVGVYLVGIILASGGAFIFQTNIMMDDWFSFSDNAYYQSVDTVRQGRPVFALLSHLAQDSFPLHPFNTVLFYATLAVFAFVVFRRWSESPWTRLLLVSLFVTSPFLAEHLQFGCNQIPMAFALLMVSLWFITISVQQEGRHWLAFAVGVVAATLAIATRWEIVFLTLGCAAIELSRTALNGSPGLTKRLSMMTLSFLLSVILAVMLIVGVVYASGLGFQSGGNYGTEGLIRSMDQLWPLVDRFMIYWKTFLFGSHFLFPAILKILFLVIFLAFVVQCIMAKDYRRILKALLVIIPLSIGPLVLGLVTTNYPFRYTAVYPLALFPCYLVCLAVSLPRSNVWARGVAIVAGSAIVVISAANLSGAQVRLNNLNRLEFSTMTQFLAQIRTADVPDWKIALLGKYPDPKRHEFRAWDWNSLECGVFNCWSNPLGSMLNLTLMDNNAEGRIFTVSDADKAVLQPILDAMPNGSSRLFRLDDTRWVILLK